MSEILISALLVIGAFFMLVAGLGMLRMPDLFLRMSCSTKAATIGVGTLMFALALYFEDLGVATRALATICFIFLTAPVGAHRIGRIAYLVGVQLWKGTITDELKGVYPTDACVPFGQECTIPNMDASEVSTDIEEGPK
ncbi:MAG: monovalent cation/H(+) antiporter subunit G [Desulfobacterales bacterium]|nr:monovalent cation/H(+) antiporter subunit G [Desulfobacterales bacterium]